MSICLPAGVLDASERFVDFYQAEDFGIAGLCIVLRVFGSIVPLAGSASVAGI